MTKHGLKPFKFLKVLLGANLVSVKIRLAKLTLQLTVNILMPIEFRVSLSPAVLVRLVYLL